MAGIVFNGETVIRPQAVVATDVTGLTPTVIASADVLMMFGSALGGQPKTILPYSDPSDAGNVLQGGELLLAMQQSWNPSPDLPGASLIRAVRVDNAAQASLTLLSSGSAQLMTLTSDDWGFWTNEITVQVAAGSVSGFMVIITGPYRGQTITETFDNNASIAAAAAAINSSQGGSVLVTATVVAAGTPADISATNLTGGYDNPPVAASYDAMSAAPASLFTLTALVAGVSGNTMTVTIEAGTSSGFKVIVTKGVTTETYDNNATVAAFVSAINSAPSALVTAAVVASGTPAYVTAAPFTGGLANGTAPQVADWEAAFALIGPNASDVYYAVTPDQAVVSFLVSAVTYTSNTKYPGRVVIGHDIGLSTAEVLAIQTPYESSFRAIIATPGIKQYNSAGAVVTNPSYLSTAPQLAGLICGMPVQISPTHKVLNGLGLELEYSDTDQDTLDQNGIVALETVPNVGLRIVDGQTTWTSDLNVARRDIAVGRIVDDISVSLQQTLEAFVGNPGNTYSLAAIKARATSLMGEIQAAGLITPGVDDAGNPQPAFLTPQVSFNSVTQVVTVTVQCSPVTTIRYVFATASFVGTNVVA